MEIEPIAGIDLGTTHSLIGIYEAGFPILLADDQGRRLTASAVYFPENEEPVAGWEALARRHREPGRTVTSVKRLIGGRAGEQEGPFPWPVWQRGGELVLAPGGKETTPIEVSAVILRKLRRIAEERMERPVTRAVITVPAYFNDAQRQATKRAGELAGFQVERILSEPTAAALSFGLDRLEERARVAVFDLGGGTFDISILEMRAGIFEVLSTAGDTRLGGDDFDEALAARSHAAALGDSGVPWADVDSVSRARMLEAAKKAKQDLSERETASLRLPFYEGTNVDLEVRRVDFDRLLQPWLAKMRRLVWRALTDAGLEPRDLEHVVLVGGSTRIPSVRELAAEIFEKEPLTSEDPDESVGRGAVIQAGILSGAVSELTLLDVTPLSLGVETYGGLMNVIIPRNTTIPVKAGEMFTNASAEQTAIRLRILQGEREMARDNWELGRIDVPFQTAAKAQARVGVQFSIDADGILTVLARDTVTETDTELTIRDAAVRVDDDAVEEMIASSLDHAFEDMSERQWTEAAMKSRELLAALEAALPVAGADFPEADRARVAALAEELNGLVTEGPSRLAELKRATAALDDATQELAAILLEKALAGEEEA